MSPDLFPRSQDASLQRHARFWGKTDRREDDHEPLGYHPLAFHNLDVAAAAVAVLDVNPVLRTRLRHGLNLDEAELRVLVATLFSLHDVGKYAEREFQARKGKRVQKLFHLLRSPEVELEDPQDPTVGHDTLGFILWRDVLHERLWDADALGIRSMMADESEDEDNLFQAWEVIEPLVQAVTGHHGSPPRPRGRGSARYFNAEAREAACAFVEELLGFLPESLGVPTTRPLATWSYEEGIVRARRASWLVAGLAVLADWLGSNTDYFPLACSDASTPEVPDLRTYWRGTAWPKAQEAVRRAGLVRASAAEIGADHALGALFPHHASHEQTPLQEYAATFEAGKGPHLVVMEDATGAGKTEAAVILAHRLLAAGLAHGLYFGLPTRATADHQHERLGTSDDDTRPPYRRLYMEDARPSYVLAHSAREHNELFRDTLRFHEWGADPLASYNEAEPKDQDDTPPPRPGQAECAAWLADRRKKALLADVGVGTIDQALLAVLPVRHQSLRVLGLATGVLIVDEVHAYDEYVSGLLRRLLWMQASLGGSAILLSATLPRAQRQALVRAFHSGLREAGYVDDAEPSSLESGAFPLATRYDPGTGLVETALNPRKGSERSVGVRFISGPNEAHRHVIDAAGAGQCVVWIRNTVDDAIEAFSKVCDEAADPARVTLLHARFTQSDRSLIEADLRKWFGPDSTPEDRSGRIVVATQVVEQSLDLDFDAMVSDLAPIDLLIQRAGRLHRHRRTAAGAPLEGDAPDERGDAELVVLTPLLGEDAASEATAQAWFIAYETLFPRARYVYPHAGLLWRTARVLADLRRIAIPEEARELLRRVYDDAVAPAIPEALAVPTKRAINELEMARARAGQSALHVAGGYGGLKAGGLHWFSDEKTPTRLGEPTTTVRLARWLPEGDEGRIAPWAGDDPSDWLNSDVPVRQSLIAAEALTRPKQESEDAKTKNARDQAFRAAVDAARMKMPDGGRWSVLAVLGEEEDGEWRGTAKALRAKWKKGKTPKLEGQEVKDVTATYSSTLGLRVTT